MPVPLECPGLGVVPAAYEDGAGVRHETCSFVIWQNDVGLSGELELRVAGRLANAEVATDDAHGERDTTSQGSQV